jgi:hypothetical protein
VATEPLHNETKRYETKSWKPALPPWSDLEMTDETQDDPVADLYGRVLVMEALLTRLLASHAKMHPRGVAARMIEDIDGMVRRVRSGLPEGAESLCAVTELHLRHHLSRAKDLRDGRAGEDSTRIMGSKARS